MDFKPGEKAPQSGLYTVIHDQKHRQNHEITCIHGNRFPPCNHCGDHVRFRIKTVAKHIKEHESFN